MSKIEFDLNGLASFIDYRLDLAFQRNATPNYGLAPLITKKEAAKLLNCSQGTIDNYARAGRIDRKYIGKSVRFDRDQILGLLRS